jgi:ribosomal protein S12 methylthiotransferase
MKACIISLGCPRNLVDSEIIAGSLKKSGIALVPEPEGADICVINTCAFTQTAREESIDKILEAAHLKKEGRIKYLVVSGCLPQLYKAGLASELREADLLVGTNDFPAIPALLKRLKSVPARTFISRSLNYLYDEKSPRITLTPGHYAYIKISEGCGNFCSYCVIPRLRGKFRSRKMKSVEEEFKALSASGKLKEVNIIGQDTTLYGLDRYNRIIFPELLRQLCRIKSSVRWIRILYTHPAHYSDELIRTIRDEERICKYLDLPLQHISDRILKRMNRRPGSDGIRRLIDKLRREIPGMALRTSVIVGFPGETEKEFKKLLGFVREAGFERLGAFMYSKEEGTAAGRYRDQVPDKIKQQRFDAVMRLQQLISLRQNSSLVGRVKEVLIDEKLADGSNKFEARTRSDAPEIDGVVYVTGDGIRTGGFCKVKINGYTEYDLMGEKI